MDRATCERVLASGVRYRDALLVIGLLELRRHQLELPSGSNPASLGMVRRVEQVALGMGLDGRTPVPPLA